MTDILALKREIEELENEVNRLSCMELAVKLVLNGGYGATGTEYFRWYDETLAAGITATGQVAIRHITKMINKFINERSDTQSKDYVVSSDTDSCYSTIQTIVDKLWSNETDIQRITDLIDEFNENEMGPYIDEVYEALSAYMNCDVNLLDMKRECIADTFIIRAKKNYIMRVFDNEGVRFADPYYKMMGIEVVRTSHPQMVRDALETSFKIVIEGTNQELRDFVDNFKQEFMSAPLNKIGAPRGITDIVKYSTKDHYPLQGVTVPMHVMAGITYNRLIKQHKLENTFEMIKNAMKIKYLPLTEINPVGSHVIGFIDEIPAEFNIDNYIDKETHFNKLFIKPLETFTIFNSWTLESNTLLDAFGSDIDIATQAVAMKSIKKVKEVKEVSSLF